MHHHIFLQMLHTRGLASANGWAAVCSMCDLKLPSKHSSGFHFWKIECKHGDNISGSSSLIRNAQTKHAIVKALKTWTKKQNVHKQPKQYLGQWQVPRSHDRASEEARRKQTSKQRKQTKHKQAFKNQKHMFVGYVWKAVIFFANCFSFCP